jgi:hypothetical protein
VAIVNSPTNTKIKLFIFTQKITVVTETQDSIRLIEDQTQELIQWVTAIYKSDLTILEKDRAFARRFGAHYRSNGLTAVVFWTPKLTKEVMRPNDFYLEVLTPLDDIDPTAAEQTVSFRRDRVALIQEREYFIGVIEGMRPGNRDRLGSFYWLRYQDRQGKDQIIRDIVPYSLPYGIFAPAELYDIDSLQENRADLDYLKRTAVSNDGQIPRLPAPNNILQIHVGTASEEGTLAGLTRIYQRISDKLAAGEALTPAEENYVGYDAIQLLPTEPTIEFQKKDSLQSQFFTCIEETDDSVKVRLRKPNTQDWGYDVPIIGSSTTSPAMLSTLRPDEVVDFIATLHNFSAGPIQLIYDLVYGHADNQAEFLISRQFLAGPNMYGLDLNHQLPGVRATFLEMQRRKLNTGVDGVRIDGAQDFRFFNPLSGRVEYDDMYLLAMSDVVQEIAGHKRLMFTIFEDGRPWPEPGWEESSTYRHLVELRPDSYQWGPLIFAHNTPALKGFWDKKWERIQQVMEIGDRWITGCANHDTVRRGNQIDPKLDDQINWDLGQTLPEVLKNSYDNPAVILWVYGFCPGLPMDFINSLMHAPWMFFRNTDERYGVKVVAEEVSFLDWQISPELYQQDWAFPRLKSLGFETYLQLHEFSHALNMSMMEKDYDLEAVAKACQFCFGEDTQHCDITALKELNRPDMVAFLKQLDVAELKQFAISFMEDCFEMCNVSHYQDTVNPVTTQFNLSLRRFRKNHPWLGNNLNLKESDKFHKIIEGERTIFYGLRQNPENPNEKIVMVTHLEGDPFKIKLGELLGLDLEKWQIVIASPGIDQSSQLSDLSCFELKQSQALLLSPKA